ncbi:Rap1a/Tai family immunity protein [Kiloniella antarctica]|uniref:Rap1a/Tai family immunity protein n=1 Tax=Kiloniella antarctica TaxID=1550907 RepID=A0ABW5BM08_9PROT
MMYRPKFLLLVVFLIFTLKPAASANYLFSDLVSQCRLPFQSGQLFCAGYLAGALEMHRLTRNRFPSAAVICAPVLKVEERKEILVEWAKAHPEHKDLTPPEGVMRAFSEKFPCP